MAAVLLFSCLMARSSVAQDDAYDLTVMRSGARRVAVQLMPLETVSTQPEAQEGAAALASRLVQDLVYSGLIALTDPLPPRVTYPRYTPDDAKVTGEEPPDYVLRLRLEGERTDQLSWVGRLMLPGGRTVVLGKRYVVNLGDVSRPVHHFADTIVEKVTGEQGIAQTRIIFSRGDGDQRELYLIDYDGENLRRITRNGSLNLAPRWSPGGDRICYTSYYRGRQRLLVLDGSTGKSHKIAEFTGLNVGACWSPVKDELVVTLSHEGNPEVYRMDPEGEIVQRLTFHDAIDCSPYFDPAGRQVVFTSDRTGVPQIYVMDTEGANRRRLTYEGRYNDSACWSPQGDRIAYVSRRGGRFQVFTIEPDGSNLQAVTLPEDANNEDPSWAPDGRHLVVSSDRGGTRKLWILDVETGVARPLTNGEGEDTAPHWSGPPRPSSSSR
jgi:TolB protein